MKRAQTDLGKESAQSLLTKERYSALLDGELSDQELDALLKSEDDLSDWDTYGLIGDVLRSPDLALSQVNLQQKEDFFSSVKSRLKQEPLIIAPNALKKSPRQKLSHWGAWLAASGFAALVAVGIIYNVYEAPEQVGLQIARGGSNNSGVVPVDADMATHSGSQGAQGVDGFLNNRPDIYLANTPNGAVLRNSQLEPYIKAHQQFSYNPELTMPAHYRQSGIVIDKAK